MPKRALFAYPDTAQAIKVLEEDSGGLVYTDIYRSAEASLAARSNKRGVQPPGYSGHNFGFSIDLDIHACLRKMKMSYAQFVDWMNEHNWFCHRMDLDPTASESWHFNYLTVNYPLYLSTADHRDPSTWSKPVEARIFSTYGMFFSLDPFQLQDALKTLGMYKGEIDGKIGPLSRAAITVFQRAWSIPEQVGNAGPRTQRTLAYLTSKVQLVT